MYLYRYKESQFMNSDAGQKKLPEKPIELIFHNVHEHGVEITNMWMKEVETRTNGRVYFTKHSGENPRAIEIADVVRDVPAIGGRYHLLDLIQTPFIFPNSTVGSKVIAQLYAEFPELRDELSDVKIVGLGIGALMAIFSSKAWGPIRTLEDFKGARIRSLLPIDGIIEAFGAKPRHVNFLEISHLLEIGELDATVLGMLPANMFKLAEGVAPYCTVVESRSITMHPMRMFMRWDDWNRLPSGIQGIIEKIGPAGRDCWYAVQSGLDADNHLVEALEYIRQNGELIKVSPEELKRWQQLIRPQLDSAISTVEAKGLPGRKFLNRMIELVEDYT
jgi:TRAP-type C4-dicarboxylate transport system substrate-binding protein